MLAYLLAEEYFRNYIRNTITERILFHSPKTIPIGLIQPFLLVYIAEIDLIGEWRVDIEGRVEKPLPEAMPRAVADPHQTDIVDQVVPLAAL